MDDVVDAVFPFGPKDVVFVFTPDACNRLAAVAADAAFCN